MFGPAFLGQVPLVRQSNPNVLPGRDWWLHHIRNTRAYAEAALAHDTQASLAAVGELWKAVLDWQKITGSPVAGVLIAEHTALAKLLVDCLAGSQGKACVDTAVSALLRNVASQAALFPKDPTGFAALFGPHTELAGAYVTDLANGDQASFQAHWADALKNGEDLGRFTDRTFFGAAR